MVFNDPLVHDPGLLEQRLNVIGIEVVPVFQVQPHHRYERVRFEEDHRLQLLAANKSQASGTVDGEKLDPTTTKVSCFIPSFSRRGR